MNAIDKLRRAAHIARGGEKTKAYRQLVRAVANTMATRAQRKRLAKGRRAAP